MKGISSKPDVSRNKWKKAYFFMGMKTDSFLRLVPKNAYVERTNLITNHKKAAWSRA